MGTAGTGGNVIIREVNFNVAGSALATGAHGQTTSVPFTIGVRVLPTKIDVVFNGSDTPALSYTLPVPNPLGNLTGFGFSSSTSGSVVTFLKQCQLQSVTQSRAEVLVGVAGGELWASVDGTNAFLVQRGVMVSSGQVSMVEFGQKMYLVDGTNAKIYDPSDNSISDWTATAGSLPGFTVSGTTTATIIENHLGRLWLAGMPFDPQNLWASAVNNPLDWDTGDQVAGSAFALTAAAAAKIGQPIKAILSTQSSRLIIGCTRSFWELTGDPISSVSVNRLTEDFGVSGKDALTLAGEGLVIGHSMHGLVAIPLSSQPQLVSAGTLSAIIQIPDTDSLLVQVLRDVTRHGCHIFLSNAASGNPATNIWYDELVGRFGSAPPSQLASMYGGTPGGYFPETYPDAVGPTASVAYLGKVVLGGRDGFLRVFDDSVYSDTGTAIATKAALGMVIDGDLDHDTLIESGVVYLSDNAGAVSMTMFGGGTPEEAYVGANRWQHWQKNTIGKVTPFARRSRSTAQVLEMAQTSGTLTWAVEEVQITTTPCMLTRRTRTVPPPPPVPCPVYVPPAVVTPPTDPNGPGTGPDPVPSCTLCVTWMNANTTGTVSNGMGGTYNGYLLTGPSDLATAIGAVDAALTALRAQAICKLPTDNNLIYVRMVVSHIGTGGGGYFGNPWLLPDLQATFLPPGAQWDGYTFKIWFTCEDNSLS
jgi:hypothetical protein